MHCYLEPGSLESTYEEYLCRELEIRDIVYEMQSSICI
ncbi:MAG: hypothetical protein ACC651_15380 [Candidatus Scalindua sp.]